MTASNDIKISVVIPVYNEESVIRQTIDQIVDFFVHKDMPYEILIVDDGSKDSSLLIIKHESQKNSNIKVLINPQNKGKGYSVREGVMASCGEYILCVDADLQVPINEVDSVMPYINQGEDIICGSRRIKRSLATEKELSSRVAASRLLNIAAKMVLALPVSDSQCGFKCFKRAVARHIFSKQMITGYGYDLEVLYVAQKNKYTIREIPIKWQINRKSRISLLREGIKMLFGIMKIKLLA
jgi:glycosyltransferase involved in cell wall biosynthesis